MESLDGRQAPTADELIGHARELVETGVSEEEAAAELAGLVSSRRALEDAHVRWQQTMHQRPSEDFTATDALRVIEAALGLVPRA